MAADAKDTEKSPKAAKPAPGGKPPGPGKGAAGKGKQREGKGAPKGEQHAAPPSARPKEQAAALRLFAELRARLSEELGIEPGVELQQAHLRVLRQQLPAAVVAGAGPGEEPSTDTPTPVQALAKPAQLPADVAAFTGRSQHLGELDRLLASGADTTAGVLSAIAGTAGVGKTALAVHAAHLSARHFPDGQLYANLHGASAGLQPLQPLDVLGRFLRALGIDPSAVPAELEEASAMFRSQVTDRRLLVVLDNAADAAQVAPLLPASSGCGALVTSRQLLTGLDGAKHLNLDVLPASDAIELLGRLVGEERVTAEPEAAAEVARCCGWLPLALRIAGARLAARPSWPVKALAERLGDTQRRLDELELAEAGVRTSFAVSCEQLAASAETVDHAAAGLFDTLGLLDGPEVGVAVVARLLDQPEEAAERALERLVDAQLLETPAPGRYRFHDLLRLYAREQASRRHPEPERAAALGRAFGLYVATAWRTLALLRPGDPRLARADDRWTTGGLELADAATALDWLDTERANLLAAIRQAAATPGVPAEITIQLAQALFGYFSVRSHWRDWVQVNQTALGIARRLGDLAAQAQAHNDLGLGHSRPGRFREALACHQQSLAIRRELGDQQGQAASLGNLGTLHAWQGQPDQALAYLRESLAIHRELGDQRGQASGLGNLGYVHERQARYQAALACHQASLEIYRELGDRRGQAASLGNIGKVHQREGRYQEALACQQECLDIFRDLGDPSGQAESLRDFGIVHQRQGRHEQALACLRESLDLYRQLGAPYGQAESLRELGMVLRALGTPRRPGPSCARPSPSSRSCRPRMPTRSVPCSPSSSQPAITRACAGRFGRAHPRLPPTGCRRWRQGP